MEFGTLQIPNKMYGAFVSAVPVPNNMCVPGIITSHDCYLYALWKHKKKKKSAPASFPHAIICFSHSNQWFCFTNIQTNPFAYCIKSDAETKNKTLGSVLLHHLYYKTSLVVSNNFRAQKTPCKHKRPRHFYTRQFYATNSGVNSSYFLSMLTSHGVEIISYHAIWQN